MPTLKKKKRNAYFACCLKISGARSFAVFVTSDKLKVCHIEMFHSLPVALKMAHVPVSDVSSACFMFWSTLKKKSPKINILFF